jgi:UDP-3-O-[3-hydroxymyristoyl] N-acetylglucosamine deacetylase
LDAAKKVLVVKKTVEVKEGEKFARLSPSEECKYSYEIKFDHPLIQVQNYDFVFTRENFKHEIGRARTFGAKRGLVNEGTLCKSATVPAAVIL